MLYASPSGLTAVTMAIKRGEHIPKVTDAPWPTGGAGRGPIAPPGGVYLDIDWGPGGGRADVVRGPGGTGGVDVYNRGNNPFIVTQSRIEQLRREVRIDAQIIADQQAQQQAVIRMCA